MQIPQTDKMDRLCIACKSALHPKAVICPLCKTAQKPGRWKSLGDFLKWVGGITAVLSLIITLGQVSSIYTNLREKQQTVSELIQIGNLQRDRGNYAAAWDSYAEAITLDPGNRAARDERVQLAMLWMRKIRSTEKNTRFSEIADQLSPLLFRGATFSKGKEAADYIAHLGWAMYLKYRDGRASPGEVRAYYDWALSEDPQNAYAHAMLGFWILFQRGPLLDAKSHFKIALSSVDITARPEIRDLQLSALLNSGGRAGEAETLRVADEMRRAGDAISMRNKDRILQIYEMNWEAERWKTLSPALAAEAHLQLLLFLFVEHDPSEKRPKHGLIEAHLYRALGKPAKALAIYQSIQQFLIANNAYGSRLLEETEAAIAALTAQP